MGRDGVGYSDLQIQLEGYPVGSKCDRISFGHILQVKRVHQCLFLSIDRSQAMNNDCPPCALPPGPSA